MSAPAQEAARFLLRRDGTRPLRGFGRLVCDMEVSGGLHSFRTHLALYECEGTGFAVGMMCASMTGYGQASWHQAALCKDLEAAVQLLESAMPDCGDMVPAEGMTASACLQFGAQRVCRGEAALHAFRNAVGAFLHGLCLQIS